MKESKYIFSCDFIYSIFRGKDKEGNREFNLDLDLYEEIDSKVLLYQYGEIGI